MAKRKPPKLRGKRGRPPKIVSDDRTMAVITACAKHQCTKEEAAAFLGVHRDTFADFLRKNKKALEAWENGALKGKVSLRATQFRLAQTNAGMAIFLGKNLLGQKDQVAHDHSGKVDVNLDEVRGAISGKLARIAAALETRKGAGEAQRG